MLTPSEVDPGPALKSEHYTSSDMGYYIQYIVYTVYSTPCIGYSFLQKVKNEVKVHF